MKLTEQQAIVLLQTLQDSLKLNDGGTIFTHNHEYRNNLWSEIMTNQLGTALIDLEQENNKT